MKRYLLSQSIRKLSYYLENDEVLRESCKYMRDFSILILDYTNEAENIRMKIDTKIENRAIISLRWDTYTRGTENEISLSINMKTPLKDLDGRDRVVLDEIISKVITIWREDG